MNLKVNFFEQDRAFNPKFEETNNISDGGYERGFAEGEAEGYEKGKTDGVAEGYEIGYNVGYAEGENSVENYLPYVSAARFPNLNLFGKADVVINMPLLKSAAEMFRPYDGSAEVLNNTVEHITINSESQPTRAENMFDFFVHRYSNDKLKHITLNVDFSKATLVGAMFQGCVNVERVDGIPLDFSSVTSPITLVIPSKLAHIRFAPNSIKKMIDLGGGYSFTDETVQSAIDGLVDLTGQTALKVVFAPPIGAKLTDEQKATITAKNWTLVYEGGNYENTNYYAAGFDR